MDAEKKKYTVVRHVNARVVVTHLYSKMMMTTLTALQLPLLLAGLTIVCAFRSIAGAATAEKLVLSH